MPPCHFAACAASRGQLEARACLIEVGVDGRACALCARFFVCANTLLFEHGCEANFASLGASCSDRACGDVAEWSKAHAWKVCKGATLSWVRIPPSPPFLYECPRDTKHPFRIRRNFRILNRTLGNEQRRAFQKSSTGFPIVMTPSPARTGGPRRP